MLAQIKQIISEMRMKLSGSAWVIAALMVIYPTLTGFAQASLRLCSQRYDVLNVALGQPEETSADHDRFTARSWWRVALGQCALLLRDSLQERYFYLFAMDVFGKEALSGGVPLCVEPRRFEMRTQAECLLQGHNYLGFFKVGTPMIKGPDCLLLPPPGVLKGEAGS